jgi:hypothetical protein
MWTRAGLLQVGLAVIVGAVLVGGPADGAAQENPTEATSGPRPYVTIIMDSSASMEWTQEGEGEYPERMYEEVWDKDDPYPQQPDSYNPEYRMGINADNWDEVGETTMESWDQADDYTERWREQCLNNSSGSSTGDTSCQWDSSSNEFDCTSNEGDHCDVQIDKGSPTGPSNNKPGDLDIDIDCNSSDGYPGADHCMTYEYEADTDTGTFDVDCDDSSIPDECRFDWKVNGDDPNIDIWYCGTDNDNNNQNLAQNCNPLAFGPCVVWEGPSDDDYDRPSWNPSEEWTPRYDDEMGDRFTKRIRGDMNETKWDEAWGVASDEEEDNAPLRLMNSSQPRHVTFKEIMAGEMVLRPKDDADDDDDEQKPIEDYNANKFGPGCWFVPRQMSASNLPSPFTPGCKQAEYDAKGRAYCVETYDEPGQYGSYPDHQDPRPHLQEVYDGRKDNGLIDIFRDKMIFSVASFDSFKFPMDGDDHELSDSSGDGEETVLWEPRHLNDAVADGDEAGENSDGEYNLGVFQITGPSEFPSDGDYIEDVNEMAMAAMADTGTLKQRAFENPSSQSTKASEFYVDPPDDTGEPTDGVPQPMNLDLENGAETYLDAKLMSRQPITGSTPLGPAIHDIHEHFKQTFGSSGTDDAAQCRSKHVITLTDGVPLPEAPLAANGDDDGVCEPVSTNGVSEAFNYNRDQYTDQYSCTERHIKNLVESGNVKGGEDDRYQPRVHVVGTSIGEGDRDEEQLRKLGSMAYEGKTCAGWYLGNGDATGERGQCGAPETDSWIPENPGDPEQPCRDDHHPCLVKQFDDDDSKLNGSFTAFDDKVTDETCPPSGFRCNFPALILQCNSLPDNPSKQEREDYRECRRGKWYKEAIGQMLNSIVKTSGLQSRTTPAIANELDDPNTSKSGQYRVYSGTNVEATNPFWSGVLVRERRLCGELDKLDGANTSNPCEDSDNELYNCFHEQIEDQVPDINADADEERADHDSRRLFTTFPQSDVYDYDDNEPTPHGRDQCGYFHSSMLLAKGDDYESGEFEDTYMADENGDGELDEIDASNMEALVDRRIPFEPGPLRDVVDQTVDEDVDDYFRAGGAASFEDLVDKIRGRVLGRDGRVLGGILNSDPVAVEPPKLDIPIDSYRQFKARYSRRPTMMYFGTLDGILHGVHTGELTGEIQIRNGEDGTDSVAGASEGADEQREAWGYLPQILHERYAGEFDTNPKLMDGAPTVKDVRLCHASEQYNQNVQACRGLCDDDPSTGGLCPSAGDADGDCVPEPMQWRTVLVQGMGGSGSGYVAMDVTRPGGMHKDEVTSDRSSKMPDPVPLWEFNPDWEAGQVQHMLGEGDNSYGQGSSTGAEQVCDGQCDPDDEATLDEVLPEDTFSGDADKCDDPWERPRLSTSHSEAAIGTVLMPALENDQAAIRRPVAVFGGGGTEYNGADEDCAALAGKAVYVVDLQTGSLLRRFTGHVEDADNPDSAWEGFDAAMIGSPMLHDNSVGSLVTRGFIGDKQGRLYRMDFTAKDPAEWTLTKFYDPTESDAAGNNALLDGVDDANLGASHVKPAAALSRRGNLVVIYGLGEPGDGTTTDKKQAVIALRENDSGEAVEMWGVRSPPASGNNDETLYEGEKLTGRPVIYNQGVYFTTFYHQDDDACEAGNSRIWGFEFGDDLDDDVSQPPGLFDCGSTALDNSGISCDEDQGRWFEPASNAMIQGLEITSGPSCSVSYDSSAGGSYTYEQDGGGSSGEPKLIAQTGGADPGTGNPGASSDSKDFVNRLEVGRDAPSSQFIPMSWSIVNQ